MSTNFSRERIEELIEAENATLDRIVIFVDQGVMAARISEENAEMLVAAAKAARDVNVRPLRELLDEEGGPE